MAPLPSTPTLTDITSAVKKFSLVDQHQKLEDQLAMDSHTGNVVSYIGVSQYVKKSAFERTRELFIRRQNLQVDLIKINNLDNLALSERSMEFSLETIILSKMFKKGLDYVHPRYIYGGYTPTTSFYGNYTDITFTVFDDRQVREENRAVRKVVGNSNIAMDFAIPIDHSIHKRDVKKFRLVVELGNAIFVTGAVWGSVKLGVELEFSAEPIPVAGERTLAVLRLPESAMQNYKHNPNFVDRRIDEGDHEVIVSLFANGQIIDFTKPENAQERLKNVGSVAGDPTILSDVASTRSGAEKSREIQKWTKTNLNASDHGSVKGDARGKRVARFGFGNPTIIKDSLDSLKLSNPSASTVSSVQAGPSSSIVPQKQPGISAYMAI